MSHEEKQYTNLPKDVASWPTSTEVIKLLDISRATLYRLEQEGELVPVCFTGNKILKHRRIRYSREAVEKLMLEYDYGFSNQNP